ncbi:hypothetical protein DRJ54_04640 [Candidatus Acetothermia bacterium]|nr:MAG: hypothetical protein DRJ54_04640 [Candidatus Acetothermia bacterium]
MVPGEREGGEVFSITAGESEFQVAPGFAAAVISWKVAGKEWLLSAFPQPRAFSWLSPWFGGIHPILYELALEEANWPGRLYREDFGGEPWTGKIGGMALSGVRLTSRLKGKGLEGLSVEVLYASPGEDVLLSALKVVNHGRPRRLAGGFLGFLSPDGEHRETALKTPGRTRIPSPYHAWYEARGWALVQAPSGAGILAVAPSRVEVGTWDAGEDGRHLGLNRSFSLAPGEGVSIWGWWVALAPGEEPTPWVALQRIPGPEGLDN